jgi:hypothetical protein
LRPETFDEIHTGKPAETAKWSSETARTPAKPRRTRALPDFRKSRQSGATGWWWMQSAQTGLHWREFPAYFLENRVQAKNDNFRINSLF